MQIQKGKIMVDSSKDLYWGIINFESESKKTRIFICSSFEFLKQSFKKNEFGEADFEKWQDGIIEKWLGLGDDLFNQDMHYDVYSITEEGEAKELNFLLEKSKS